MLPSRTVAGTVLPLSSCSVTASSLVMAGTSRNTSTIRLAQATDRVIIMNIMDTIISEIMIWVM